MVLENHAKAQVLSAKLSRPRLNAEYRRRRVFDVINAGNKHAAIWISGPAGSGKTTVVNSFLKDRNAACQWYTLDKGDDDVASFFLNLRKAAAIYCPLEDDLPPPLTPDYFSNPSLISLFAKRFFEQLFALVPVPFALVLDDYQEVGEHSPLHQVVGAAISQIPRQINVYILSREEPPPELARHRANSLLYLLGWKHLQLALDETRHIAHMICGLDGDNAIFMDLQAKTDGWIAGLILLLRRGQFEGITPQRLSRQTPQEIFDYLNGELFEKLPSDVQERMLQLAFLPRISINAANTVTARRDAAKLLHYLHRGNAFLDRLVGEDIFYRFHPLVQAFLKMRARQTLSSETLKEILHQSAVVLAREGVVEEAVHLYIACGEIPKAIQLILEQAPVLSDQGCFMTLEKLIDALPDGVHERIPWCIYWRAACRLPYAAREGGDLLRCSELRELFKRALSRFEQADDAVGSYLALAGILESIWVETNDFSSLDPWIAKYVALRAKWGRSHPPETINWLIPSLVSALVLRQPDHEMLPELVEMGMDILRTTPEPFVAIRMFLPIAFLNLLQGNHMVTDHLIKMFKWSADENASPLGVSVFHAVFGFYGWLSGAFDDCVRIAEDAVRIEKQYGNNRLLYPYPLIHSGIGALNIGDIDLAERLLGQAEPFLHNRGHWALEIYNMFAGWIALVKKDNLRAKSHALAGLDAGRKAGCPSTFSVCHLQCALSHHFFGERDIAKTHLEAALELSRRVFSRQVEFGCHLAKAEFAMAEGNQELLTQALKEALRLGREHGYVVTYFWRSDIMAELCVRALERDIEVDYTRHLIRRRRLIPAIPPRGLKNWPWVLTINTLGGFSLKIDGNPVTFDGKAQLRPLSVLMYLVAKGGRGVSVSRLQDDLWPDSDGDHAASALKIALHRLRKMLGGSRSILLSERRLSLNDRICWTDVWAFEDICKETDSLLQQGEADIAIKQVLDRLLALYSGSFLPDEEAHWCIRTRQRLTMRFVDLVQRSTRFLVEKGAAESALNAVKKALIAVPLEVSLYHLLMEHYCDIGDTAGALKLFEQYPQYFAVETGQGTPSAGLVKLQRILKSKHPSHP